MITPKPAIRGSLIGSNRCDAEGYTARGSAPVFKLCRVLLKAGYDPGRPLHAYRGEVHCLAVGTIGEGARLTVKTAGNGYPIFAPAEGAAAPPVRKYNRPLGDHSNLDGVSPDK
jgi:hypothetical protein